MASVITNDGKIVIAEAYVSGTTDIVQSVALGTGTSNPDETDSSMDEIVFEAERSDNIVNVQGGTDPGEYIFQITIQGGTEVPGGTDITEIGLKTDADVLLYRETRSAITVEDGSSVTIQFSLQPSN